MSLLLTFYFGLGFFFLLPKHKFTLFEGLGPNNLIWKLVRPRSAALPQSSLTACVGNAQRGRETWDSGWGAKICGADKSKRWRKSIKGAFTSLSADRGSTALGNEWTWLKWWATSIASNLTVLETVGLLCCSFHSRGFLQMSRLGFDQKPKRKSELMKKVVGSVFLHSVLGWIRLFFTPGKS